MDFVMIIGILVVFSIIVVIVILSVKEGLKEKQQAQEKDQKEQTRHLENVEKLYISIYNKLTHPKWHKMVVALWESEPAQEYRRYYSWLEDRDFLNHSL